MVTEQGAQTLGLQAVWTGAGPGTRMKYVGISYGRNKGVMIIIIDNNTRYHLLRSTVCRASL